MWTHHMHVTSVMILHFEYVLMSMFRTKQYDLRNLFTWLIVRENYKNCCCLLTVPVLNCSFGNDMCDYIVSNTSTSFTFSEVFSISSLGKLHQIPFHAECVYMVYQNKTLTVFCHIISIVTRKQNASIQHGP